MKRTYNLSPAAVATAKRLVEEAHVAPSQDSLVERAILELARRYRDAAEAEQWARASADDAFQDELAALDRLFAEDDAKAWQ
ncbi:MAG: hypothetical protein KGJ86_18610 [Chloroflexota bacterium]|nr:hypothetical protein [Chloroflexota bacterium]